MLVWAGDPKPSIEIKTTVKSHGVGLSWLSFGSHTGTHIDASSHFIEGGSGIDAIDLKKLIGTCRVLDLTHINHLEITPDDLSKFKIKKGERILFKTGNYKLLKKSTFPKEYISLSLEGAKYLVKRGIVLVGTDFLGIEKQKNPGHPVHTTLLKAKVVNVEGLDLEKVPAGKYQLIVLPLRVSADGSPARAVLVKN